MQKINIVVIQRVQSLYLLGVIILSVFSFFDFKEEDALDSAYAIEAILCVIIFMLSLVTIFMFKNMKMQFILGRLNILVNLLFLGLFVYYSLNLSEENDFLQKGIGRIVPLLNIVLIVLANKAIKRDDKLVRSADRIR